MSERPLLVFPRPTVAEKSRRFGGGSKAQVPDVQSQSDRLTPKLQRLQQTFDQGRARLQRDTFGLQPEQVLVLETVGPIERFLSAVRRIQGLEWLGELELEEIEPGDGFQDPKRPAKMLSGRVFLIMTDQQALHELQRLFDRWRENPEMKFPLGLNSLRRAFAHLKDIRPWDARDRLQDTGVLEDWQIRMELGQEVVPFEVELWFRNDPARRDAIDRYMRRVISGLDGEIAAQCVLPDIAYHALLGKLPIDQIESISRFDDVELIQAEDVMHFRPVGQCAMRFPEDPEAAIESTDVGDMPPSQEEPIIALFDGLPLEKHALLDGRLRIDDPDNFEAGYQARERVHGTAMASLICHGELDALGPALEIPLYVRPILQPNRWYEDEFVEQIPDDTLPVDLIHRAVLRLFLGEGGEPPVAPGTKVINLSIGDVSRPFDRAVSP